NGHRGSITSLTRRGLVPRPHAAPAAPPAADIPTLLARGLRARTRALRALAGHEEAHGRPGQGALGALGPHVQALGTSLDATSPTRFLRHLVRHWDVHRHRIAREVAAQLDAASTAGRLRRLAGHLVAIEPGIRTAIAWRPRGRDAVERFEADVVVNALGMEKRIDRDSGLLAGLCARGLLRPGPHGMGAATVGEGVP